MLVDLSTADDIFAKLPEELKSPYFHPYFVVNDSLRDPSLTPLFFVYQEGGEIFYHAFHLGKVEGTLFFDIQSPYDYGGPLATTCEPDFLAHAWQHYLTWCRENRVLAEFIRFHPLLENWRFYPGEILPMRETVWLDLQENNRFASYTTRVRTAIRKAATNGLRVEWRTAENPSQENSGSDNPGQVFINLYTEAMLKLQADKFYFFPDAYFDKLMSWPQTYLALCFQKDTVLGAALFMKQSYLMEYHLAGTRTEGQKLCAANLILDEAAKMAQDLGCRKLHLGGGTDNTPGNSLLFFKSGFSPKRAFFRIGKIIHAPREYEKLQKKWQDRFGQITEKILFYRFPPDIS
ncbi:MAG: hypothetical protein GX434_03880 [Peptococcaceae bacterium]|nr:hypothetical protein [Peptococcaceae bacterium]